MKLGLGRSLMVPLLLATLACAVSCSGGSDATGAKNAKSAILLVGDGMGPTQRTAIRLATVGPGENLEMDDLPHSGFSRTNSVGAYQLTDSAAGGTAIASGVKTLNNAVGVDAEGRRVRTLLEQAKGAGKSVGLVTTSQVTDATPAAFAAHVRDRNEESEIARQYLDESRPDVILGGGEDYWYPEGDPGAIPDDPPEEASRGSEGDLVEKAENLGYEHVSDAEGLESAEGPKLLGLFANEEMWRAAPEGEGAVYDPEVPLPQMTRKAIEVLSRDEQGFFLVVEEEAIDGMGHANNAELTLESGKLLDEAVGVAKGYAEENPDTLLVTAADHETGGMSIDAVARPDLLEPPDPGEDGPFRVAGSEDEFVVDWTTSGHTASEVPITAAGPGAAGIEGVHENTHLYDVIRGALALD